MKKIGIIGVGHVGSTTAQNLIQRKIADELVLFDKNTAVVEAEINDLLQGQIGTDLSVKISGNPIDEQAALASCDILIMAAGDITLLAGDVDRVEELYFTQKVVEEWAPKIKASGFAGVLISITNPCDVIAGYLQKLTDLPNEKVIGTGTSLDTARMQQTVVEIAGVHPNSISGFVLGEHGDTQFTAWSTLRIAEKCFAENFSPAEIADLEVEIRAKASRIYLGKGYTSYGIANQAAIIAEAVLTDSKKIIPVSTFSKADDIFISQPTQIGAGGVQKVYPLPLNEIEVEKWKLSIARIKEMRGQIR